MDNAQSRVDVRLIEDTRRMDIPELDAMIDEVERSTALGHLEALTALCEQAEAERLLSECLSRNTGASEHAAAYGHRLSFGCCLRAAECGRPSLLDVV